MRDQRFEQFVRVQSAGLLRLAFLLTRDHRDAEDLVQEVLLSALRKWDTVTAADRPDAYVRRMLVNNHISSHRRSASRELPLGADLVVMGDPHSTERLDEIDARSWAANVMGQLPRRQRAVLVLRYYERLDDVEIADILGVARGTVRSLAARAFDALRRHPELMHYADPPERDLSLRTPQAASAISPVTLLDVEGRS
jgi:RNA polymerase sigma-70 factor (sigma-E family)